MFGRVQPQRSSFSPRNAISGFLGGLGSVLEAGATSGESVRRQQEEERRQQEEERRRQELQQLGNILAGSQIPEFAREEQTPEQIQQAQLKQLAALGTPEAVKVVGQFLPTPERQLEREKLQLQVEQEKRASALQTRQQALAEKKFSLELKKFDKQLEQGGLSEEDQFKRATDLRKEFRDLSKDFIKQRDAYGRVIASAENPSAAGDLALIFNFMKVLDPGSTVREGEFANAQNAGSVPDTIVGLYNRVRKGERLSASVRQDFLDRAKKLFTAANKQHSKRVAEFTTLAQKVNAPIDQVIIDLGLAEQEVKSDQLTPQQALPQTSQLMGEQSIPQANQPTPQDALAILRSRGRIQ